MRARTWLAPAFLLLAVGCESKGDDERTRDEWIVLCESQTGVGACEDVSSATFDGETLRCENLIVVRTSAPDCISGVNDSRCFAVSDAAPTEPGYIFTEPGDPPQIWLIEGRSNTSVYGSAIENCTLADDGVSWTPEPVCECAGKVTDDPGGW